MPDIPRPDIEGLLKLAESASDGPWGWWVSAGYDDDCNRLWNSIDPAVFESTGYSDNPRLFSGDPNRAPEGAAESIISAGSGEYIPYDSDRPQDATFIAVSRSAIPALVRYALSLEAKLRAADRLARYVCDLTHGEECEWGGDLDAECEGCADGSGPCECSCGMDAAWRDALVIRPHGVKDPQPTKEAARG